MFTTVKDYVSELPTEEQLRLRRMPLAERVAHMTAVTGRAQWSERDDSNLRGLLRAALGDAVDNEGGDAVA